MKINSLKLTIQDTITADKKRIAAVFGTVFIDNDKFKEEDGVAILDKNGEKIPVYETINFTTAVDSVEYMSSMIQQMVIEALTLKNMKIAEKNGELSHFIEAMGATEAEPAPGFRKTMVSTKIKKEKPSKPITKAEKTPE